MKKLFFITLFLFFIFLPLFSSAQTEVVYPNLPDILSPQEILENVTSQEQIFPLFVAYFFRLLLIVSIFVTFVVVLYGGIIYLLSKESVDQKRGAKSWIISAVHGTIIIFISYLLLFLIGSQFVVFNLDELEEITTIERVTLEWLIHNTYFQIPFGLLIEDAALNEKARDQFYDILDNSYNAEDSADAIVWGGKDLLGIIDVCPVGTACCDDFPFCEWPPIPFAALQRTKEPRPDLNCFWTYRARRSSSSSKMSPPPMTFLPAKTLLLVLGLPPLSHDQEKANISSSLTRLKIATDTFFPEPPQRGSREWEMEKALTDIIKRIEEILIYQKNYFELIIEFSKITREFEHLAEDFPLLRDPPFKEAVDDLFGFWTSGEESLPKGDFGPREAPFIGQDDIRWRHIYYGIGNLYNSGCLLAATSMVFQYFGADLDILKAKDFALRYGYGGFGTTWDFVGHIARVYGLNNQEVHYPGPGELNRMIDWLETRGPIIIGGKGHPWSMGGMHALTLTGADRSKGIVYISNTGRSFQHSATFGEVMANMPLMISYISRTSSLKEDNLPVVYLANNSGCEDCPEISCAIINKIMEINQYMEKLNSEMFTNHFLKDIKKEDLYHLYKALMLKSLGDRHVINYPSLLLEKSYYNERTEITIETDDDFTKIHRLYGHPEKPYIWDWQPWINNILYEKDIDCNITIENDPATFYLKKPFADEIIEDALSTLSFRRKQSDIQYLSPSFPSKEHPNPYSLSGEFYSAVGDMLKLPLLEEVFAQTPLEKVYLYLLENNIDPSKLTENRFREILNELGLSPSDISLSDIVPQGSPHAKDSLICGMEIPMGETFQLIWDHFTELLFVMDAYTLEGMKLKYLQEMMNYMASFCSCPCADPCCDCACGDEDCPCGSCVLTCDKAAIESLYYNEIIPQRIQMARVARYLKHLTEGFFNDPTENLCSSMNEDIRNNEEQRLCSSGGNRFITKHELITRKLNYSRVAFDDCSTRTEQFDSVLERERAGKVPIFGPIAELQDLPRYTKTKVNGFVVNTHKFNWFCCSDSSVDR